MLSKVMSLHTAFIDKPKINILMGGGECTFFIYNLSVGRRVEGPSTK
jgi:hypothetical protein